MPRVSLPLLLMMVSATARPVVAQGGGTLAELSYLPSSTRAMALGDAFVFERRTGFGSSGDVDALFYHPAGVRGGSGASLAVHRTGSDGGAMSLAAGRDLWGGSVALGVQALSSVAGAFMASGAFAHAIHGVDVGIVAKLVDLSAGGEHGSGAAVDLGVGRQTGPVYVAVSGRNIGAGPELGSARVDLPWTLALGAATGSNPVGPLDVAGAFSLRYGEDEEWVPAGGIEISWWPVQGRTFTGRIGLRRVPVETRAGLSLGLAFTGDTVSFEYAFRPNREDHDEHRFGVIWR